MSVAFSGLCVKERGRLRVLDRQGLATALAEYGAGEEIEITLRSANRARLRSQKANAYLWSVVYALMAVHTGHAPEDIHDAMCERFLPSEQKRVAFFNKLTGETLEVDTDARRSSKLTGGPFYDFVETVRIFAREFLDVDTPDPDPEFWRKRESRDVTVAGKASAA